MKKAAFLCALAVLLGAHVSEAQEPAPSVPTAQEPEPAPPAGAPVITGAPAEGLIAEPAPAAAAFEESDPWQGVNRKIFWFNDQVDVYVLEPAATGYDWIVPDRAQTSVANFFRNVRFPVVLGNDLLQGKMHAAATEVGRFAVNTTVGVAGLFDPATGWGLVSPEEDFGQTLGWWGGGHRPLHRAADPRTRDDPRRRRDDRRRPHVRRPVLREQLHPLRRACVGSGELPRSGSGYGAAGQGSLARLLHLHAKRVLAAS